MTAVTSTTITIFMTTLFLPSECVQHSKHYTPDTHLSPPQIIRRHGYTAEAHIIETADGYLLEYHRIPHGKNVTAATRKYPILLHHGVLSSSADWVTTEPKTSLPYELADNGFDVWLANARGNTYSRGHVEYSLSDRDFWNFSFHEVGFYDIPAAIDHILNVTCAQKMIYIGHSMGTTSFYVFASTRPDYKDKILFQISLAPIAAIPHCSSSLAIFVPYAKKIEKVANYLQNGAFLEQNSLGYSFCKLCPNCCEELLFTICGVDREQWNTTLMPVIASKGPGGTSTKTAVHLSQLVSTGKFRHYDYGKKENLKKYKTETPPPYKVNDSEIPMKFYYGRNDLLADPRDVEKLYREVSYPMGLTLIKYEKWNHIDFLWAVEINKYFINPLLEFVINAVTDDNFVKRTIKTSLAERAAKRLADDDHTSNESQDDRSRLVTKDRHHHHHHHRIRNFLMKGLRALTMNHKYGHHRM